MKKLVFGLIATVMLSATSFAQETPPKEDPPLIQIEFGRKSLNCAGFGICVFKINITTQDVKTLLPVILTGGMLRVQMPADFYKEHAAAFRNGYLIVDEDLKLDSQTTKALRVRDGYTIRTGKYRVVFDKSTNTYNCTF